MSTLDHEEIILDKDDEDEDDLWVEAFKTGTHTDSQGNQHTWTAEHLSTIASQYNARVAPGNPEHKQAPVVLGHPKDDSPAYGWIDKVKVRGDKLMAHLDQLNGAFVQALKDGAYKFRSISLYPDLNIRHLGFLGGMQPAVAGLAPYKFADATEATTFEFANQVDDIGEIQRENRFFNRLFQLFHEDVTKHKSEPKTGPIDTKEIDMEGSEKIAAMEKSFTELQSKYDALVAEHTTLTASYAEAQAKVVKADADAAAALVAAKANANKQFCDECVSEGRMRPADVAMYLKVMNMAQAQDEGANDFAETKATPEMDAYRSWLKAQPKVVEFGDTATGKTSHDAPDPLNGADTTDRVTEFCDAYIKADPKMSYPEAMRKCQEEHPAEFTAYWNLATTTTK
jgi:hypothetical protein